MLMLPTYSPGIENCFWIVELLEKTRLGARRGCFRPSLLKLQERVLKSTLSRSENERETKIVEDLLFGIEMFKNGWKRASEELGPCAPKRKSETFYTVVTAISSTVVVVDNMTFPVRPLSLETIPCKFLAMVTIYK